MSDATMNKAPERPEQLTLEFFKDIASSITQDSASSEVCSFNWKPLDVGVLSQVVGIEVQFKHLENNSIQSSELIAKFLRPNSPFESMFTVESTFYKQFQAQKKNQLQPFEIPGHVYLSNHLIIIHRIPSIQTYVCVDGCPSHWILPVIEKLAQFHARFWSYDCSELATPAGIGSGLTGETKQEKFPSCWANFVGDLDVSAEDRAKITAICEILCANSHSIKTIHDVATSMDGPTTLIHGDFHTANLLFSNPNNDPLIWLVDWATCGRGNPMLDFVFFLVVGVTVQDRRELEKKCLELYVQTIENEKPTEFSTSRKPMNYEEWKQQYLVCVVNQFTKLVIYDELTKSIAANSPTVKQRDELMKHFREVNKRSVLTVLDNLKVEDFQSLSFL